MLLEAEVHHRVVMEILGHSSVSKTLDLYSHVSPELQREVTRRLDRAWDLLGGTPANADP
jgi:site-specific recombinase XerD